MGCSTSTQKDCDPNDPVLTPSRLCSEAAGFAEREADAQALALSGSPRPQAPPVDPACCSIAGLLQASPNASSLHSWATYSGAGFVRVQEAPAYYKEVLLPFYRQLSMPALLERMFSGGLKVVNCYGRAGLLAVIGDETCHGAFLLMPNPGYHDTVTRAVRAVMKGKGTQQELQVAVAAAEAEGYLAAPSFSGGYAYLAWWVPPTHVLPVRALVDTLRREGEEIRSGACPFGDSGSPGLLLSVETLVQDLEKGCARGAGYLHTLRDLTPADAPLLSLLLSEGSSFLSSVAGQRPSTMAFHYPYQKMFSSLHVHIHTPVYPHATAGSGRRLFHVSELLQDLQAGTTLADVPCGYWWGEDDREMDFLASWLGPECTHLALAPCTLLRFYYY